MHPFSRGLYNAKTDVFSLGAVLYNILCGAPPFGGNELDDELIELNVLIGAPLLGRHPSKHV
jgi:serine/threonine protein kinase